jgi:protein involved in polysaccharide export with SLBB domain
MSFSVGSGKETIKHVYKKVFMVAMGIAFVATLKASAQQAPPFGFDETGIESSIIYSLKNPTQYEARNLEREEEPKAIHPIEKEKMAQPEKSASKASKSREPKVIETKGLTKAVGNVDNSLKFFGYDIFSNYQSFSIGSAKMEEGYQVGPGDVFQIAVWGSEEASFTAEINSNGYIMMPTFGKAKVKGLSFRGLKTKIKEVISRDLTGFELSVLPVKPRKNNIFVVGEVSNPGVFDLSGASSVLTSLFAAGGPKTSGTLRNVEVRRGKKLIGRFDVYDFLLSGDRSKDLNLRDGDTVFVPMAGPRVAVSGAVKRAAIFELKHGEMTLGDAIEVAGGIIPTADLQKIQIQRLMAHKQQVVFSREISRSDNRFSGNSTVVQDLDSIRVFSISPRKRQMVTIEGHVFEPGPRPWAKGIMLSQILKDFDMLKKEPALDYGEILREGGVGGEYQVVSFNPGKILSGESDADVELMAKDRIVIFPQSLMKDKAMVSITGHVINSGAMSFTPGMRVKDLVFRSGGLKNGVSLTSAELSRRDVKLGKLALTRIEIDLGKAMKDDPRHNIAIKPFDSLMIRGVPDWKINNFVTLSGEFKYPGKYSFQPGEKLSSVIKRAQGFSNRAYLKAAVFTRQAVRNLQVENNTQRLNELKREQEIEIINDNFMADSYSTEKKARKYVIEQQKGVMAALEKTQPLGRVVVKLDELPKFSGTKFDLTLKPGDNLHVPARPSSVMVEGAVYNSMGILWELNKSIRYYLNKVGGATRNGDVGNIYLIRADGTVVSRKNKGRNFLNKVYVEPGDTVFVPTRIRVPVDRWKRKLDVIRTFSSLITTLWAVDKWRD